MKLKIGKEEMDVKDLADASRKYNAARRESGASSEIFPGGKVFENGKIVARISYNGRVWRPGEWKSGDKPIMESQEKI